MPSSQETAEEGRSLVGARLEERGWRVSRTREGNVPYLVIEKSAKRRRVRVSTRRRGTWQTSTRYGLEQPDAQLADRFWVFVDLANNPTGYYVLRENDVRLDIEASHQRYLQDHGGHRAVNDNSNHHAIALERIAEGQDRWDLIDASVDCPQGSNG